MKNIEQSYLDGNVVETISAAEAVYLVLGDQQKVFDSRNAAWAQRVINQRPEKALVALGLSHLVDPLHSHISFLDNLVANG